MTLVAALVLGVAGALAGVAGPWTIARLPEPVEVVEGKISYREVAQTPSLGWWLAAGGLVLGVGTGAAIGWHPALVPWGYLIPLGVVLAAIDLRVRLLPTRLIAPSYLILVVLVGVAAAIAGSAHLLEQAAFGWVAVGGLYLVLWLIAPRGIGYGDVRFSGVLGIALGCVGWPAVIVGAWFGFLLGGLSGLFLRPFTGLKMNAHGPAMVVGAVIGVIAGSPLYHAVYR